MSRKSNISLKEFIEIYKSEPCLWLKRSKEYHDRNKKATAYVKLIDKLKELEPNATKDTVVKKINSLRSNIRKEKKKYEESLKSGASADDVYKPTLWYYNLFDFLGNQDIPQNSYANLIDKQNHFQYNFPEGSTENTIGHTEKSTHGDEDMIQNEATRPNQKKSEQEKLITDVLLTVRDYLKRPSPVEPREDRYDLLGKTIAMKLRTLEKRQRLLTEKIINDTLFEAEMGNLNNQSYHSHLLSTKNMQQYQNDFSSRSPSPTCISSPSNSY